MKKTALLLLVAMLTVILSGCIISKTPSTNEVTMTLGEQMTFSLNVVPTGGTFAWTLDNTTLSTTGSSYSYTAEAGDHVLTVTAKHLFGTDTYTWNIKISNPPVADAGKDQSVIVNSTVTLDGSGSTDPDNNIVSYQWEQTDGPTVTLTNANSVTAQFTSPITGSTLTFKLTVIDATGLQSTDTCIISVSPTTKVGPFIASYYNGTTFVASETVTRPSINYIWSEFHGIDSYNFHATWKGNIEVFNDSKFIDLNFNVSWSDVSLFVDGVEIASWSNSNRIIHHEFSPGVHEIMIEYYNHWHTTGFNVSFTSNSIYSKDEAISLIRPQIDGDTKVIYVGCYESANLYNNSTVTFDSTASKVFLFLSSYASMNWIIQNPHNVTITGIAYSSYGPKSTVSADKNVPTFEIAGIAYGYSDFSAPSADINYIVGMPPDYTYGVYGLTEVLISLP